MRSFRNHQRPGIMQSARKAWTAVRDGSGPVQQARDRRTLLKWAARAVSVVCLTILTLVYYPLLLRGWAWFRITAPEWTQLLLLAATLALLVVAAVFSLRAHWNRERLREYDRVAAERSIPVFGSGSVGHVLLAPPPVKQIQDATGQLIESPGYEPDEEDILAALEQAPADRYARKVTIHDPHVKVGTVDSRETELGHVRTNGVEGAGDSFLTACKEKERYLDVTQRQIRDAPRKPEAAKSVHLLVGVSTIEDTGYTAISTTKTIYAKLVPLFRGANRVIDIMTDPSQPPGTGPTDPLTQPGSQVPVAPPQNPQVPP